MKLYKSIAALGAVIGLLGAQPASATTTYTYTNPANSLFSGSFSVANALADGAYSFGASAPKPAGFAEAFFPTYSYVFYGSTVTIAPALSVFDVNILHGQVSTWDIVFATPPTTLYTRISNYNVGRAAIITDTTSTTGDFQVFHFINLNSSAVNVSVPAGVWSGGGMPAVPEPATCSMLLIGMIGLAGLTTNRKKQAKSDRVS
jgi:hypothetical protein